MSRLTKEMRSQIIANAIEKAGLNVKASQNEQARKQWAEDVRLDSVGGPAKEKELQGIQAEFDALLARVPRDLRSCYMGLLGKRPHFHLNLAGARIVVKEFEGQKVAPYEHTILADNALVQRFYDLEAADTELLREKEKVTVNVRAVIEQANTIKQLLEIWPECVELLPAVEERKATLPAVKVADLNALVGLPTDIVN